MAKVQKSMRAESKKDYTTAVEEGEGICLEQLRTGALLRIADATEIMARRHTELIEERDRYRKAHDMATAANLMWSRRCAYLRGVITKLKNSRWRSGQHKERGKA